MNPRGLAELVLFDGIAQLSREAERERLARLVRTGRGGNRAQPTRSARWGGWAGRIRAARTQLLHSPPSGRPELHTRSAVSGARWPAQYQVRVEGVLDGRWSEWFEGLHIDSQYGETTLSGTLPDQSALHGILEKVRNLGLSVITVRRLLTEEEGGEHG